MWHTHSPTHNSVCLDSLCSDLLIPRKRLTYLTLCTLSQSEKVCTWFKDAPNYIPTFLIFFLNCLTVASRNVEKLPNSVLLLFPKSNMLLKIYFISLNRTRNWCVGEDDAGYDASWWRNEKPQLQFQTWKILLGRPETTDTPICLLIGSLQNGFTPFLALDKAQKCTQTRQTAPRTCTEWGLTFGRA